MKVLVLLSGGVDSTTALAREIAGGNEVAALSFDYGQRHSVELQAAIEVAAYYAVDHEIVELKGVFDSRSALMGGAEVPSGEYTEESLAVTVVPGRNLVMIAIAAAKAQAGGFEKVVVGCHAGDHAVYPDCAPAFLRAAMDAVFYGSGKTCDLDAPFAHKTKKEIVEIGRSLNAPHELTYSCYKGGPEHCGECSTCRERTDALG